MENLLITLDGKGPSNESCHFRFGGEGSPCSFQAKPTFSVCSGVKATGSSTPQRPDSRTGWRDGEQRLGLTGWMCS